MRKFALRHIAEATLITAIALLVLSAAALSAELSTPRLNLSEFAKDAARVESLKKGIRVMRSRKPSDPRSWFFQGAIHGVTADAIAEAQQRDPEVAKVEQQRFWNQCPHNGQAAADFLPWHRAYLYYFERILREAAEDSSLTLPYWDYTGDDRTFPALLADADADPVTREPRNPLYEVRRELAFVRGIYALSDRAVSTTEAFDARDFFGATEASGFAGGVGDSDRLTQGLVERRPHNSIHFAVGGMIGEAAGLMASVQTAAFDPIFWIHHANIDRLWSTWECLPSRSWGAVPPATWLNERPWSFYDTDLSVHALPRLHYLTYKVVGVTYDTDEPNCKRLSETSPQPPQPPLRAFLVSRRLEVGVLDGATQLSANDSITRPITLTAAPAFGEVSFLNALEFDAKPRRLLLELRGIDYDGPPSVGYDVYVNLPKSTAPDPQSIYFVGTLSLFGVKHGTHHDEPAVQRFDITGIARREGFDPKQLSVTIVPFDLFVPQLKDAPPLRRSGSVRIRSMAVVLAEGEASE